MTDSITTISPFPELFRDDALRLETRRLWLRWPSIADVDQLHAIASMEAVARQTATWPHPFPGGEAERRIAHAREINRSGRGLRLALTARAEPGRLIGLIGVDALSDAHTVEMGYLLAVAHQGYGLMTEAARALTDTVFRYTPVNAIRGASGTTNLASRRVMEKAGFAYLGGRSYDAPARGASVACDELELTRADWCARQATKRLLASRSAASGEPNEIPRSRAA